MAIHFMPGNFEGVLIIKLGAGNMQETIEFVQQKWEDFGTEHPFEYSWLDDTFNKMFDAERRTGHILTIFSILSVFIPINCAIAKSFHPELFVKLTTPKANGSGFKGPSPCPPIIPSHKEKNKR